MRDIRKLSSIVAYGSLHNYRKAFVYESSWTTFPPFSYRVPSLGLYRGVGSFWRLLESSILVRDLEMSTHVTYCSLNF